MRFEREAAFVFSLAVAFYARRFEDRLDVARLKSTGCEEGRGSFAICSGVSFAEAMATPRRSATLSRLSNWKFIGAEFTSDAVQNKLKFALRAHPIRRNTRACGNMPGSSVQGVKPRAGVGTQPL
jgi:hypothetical protein